MTSVLWINLLAAAVLLVSGCVLWRLFGSAWQAADEASYAWRTRCTEARTKDWRPLCTSVTAAIALTWREYYGTSTFYFKTLHQPIRQLLGSFLPIDFYSDWCGQAWAQLSLFVWYVGFPLLVWCIFFPQDAVLDFGMRTRGFFKHAWVYSLFLALVVVGVCIASLMGSFISYYPFYRLSSRSWLDLVLWELVYLPGFFAIEFFFRGWWMLALQRSIGSAAIFVVTVPYCMIHFGKPYVETLSTLVGSVALGSLSIKTKSIYQGTLLHMILALSMDCLALWQTGRLPEAFWP